MSRENVEVVKVAYEAFARGGLDRWIDHLNNDVEWRAIEGDIGPIHGKDALRAWLQDWIDTFEGLWMEPLERVSAPGNRWPA
jgi:ketosteroid isomerase-like protein